MHSVEAFLAGTASASAFVWAAVLQGGIFEPTWCLMLIQFFVYQIRYATNCTRYR